MLSQVRHEQFIHRRKDPYCVRVRACMHSLAGTLFCKLRILTRSVGPSVRMSTTSHFTVGKAKAARAAKEEAREGF